MDPDELLRTIRSHVSVIQREGTPASTRATHGEWLAERVGQLDEWLTRGGFKPADWEGDVVEPIGTNDRVLAGPEAVAYEEARIATIQRELNTHPTWREGDPCALCGEPEDAYDPIGHFVDPAHASAYVMAHGQCGVDAGLRLA